MSDDSRPCPCNGARWICAEHDRPGCDCGAPLKPCECNEDATLPLGWRCVSCIEE
jgi:hypothetical protein